MSRRHRRKALNRKENLLFTYAEKLRDHALSAMRQRLGADWTTEMEASFRAELRR